MTDRDNKRSILRGVIVRESANGHGVRPHEIERAVNMAELLWVGEKGNGQAANEAMDIIRRGADT